MNMLPREDIRLILASRSPRRRELLAAAKYSFEVVFPSEEAEGGGNGSETPAQLVARLAYRKAGDVAKRIESGIVLACDTVVECGNRILGKPADEDDARQMLELLRGRTHRVFSGLCLWKTPKGPTQIQVDTTILQMDAISDQQIAEYLASGTWTGKAGAFGYQDRLDWVHIVEGSESNVVGLPMELLAEMLAAMGSK
jgi:septum formation protein